MQAKETAEVEIIKLLRTGGQEYISGQSLSSALGISRTAIWKHIKNIRKMGYTVQASPKKGYRLEVSEAPFNALEISSGLSTEFMGRKIYFYPSLDSTNIKAFELGRAGAPEGTAIIADSQSKGKGRVGRKWESPPGVNLYTSVILRPDISPLHAQNLTFLAAVAVAETVEAFCLRRPTVKWPNDILIDSRKVAGILMEMDSEADRIHFVIAGIGVNINIKERMFPDYIKAIATSIAEKRGTEVGRAEFTRGLYSNIEKWYKIYLKNGFTPVLDAWRGFFDAEGRMIRVVSFNRTIEGMCAGVDSDGALLVRLSSGAVERVISGDVESGR